jgi:hypothetical protein
MESTKMNDMQIKKGDKVWVQGDWKRHYGVCVGHDLLGNLIFIHNSPAGGVTCADRRGFAGRREIQVEQHAPLGHVEKVVGRAWALCGRDYNLLFFNCEHVANLAVSGQAESPQLQRGVALLSALGLLFVALNNNGTSTDRNGYRRDSSGRFAARRWW